MATTFQFTDQELKNITTMTRQFIEKNDSSKSIKENMVAYLTEAVPGMTTTMCEETVDSLVKGITSFTDAYREFCDNDEMPLYDRCMDIIKDRPAQEQAACIINFIAMLKTMDASVLTEVLGDTQADLMSKFEEFCGSGVSEDISEEQIEELRNQLRDAISNNAVCLAGEEQMKDLLAALSADRDMVKTLIEKQVNEFDYKCYAALAAYISYKQGTLASFPEDVNPEVLGASIAAGIERAKVIAGVKSGIISWDQAFKLLKYIGGALLLALFIWVNYNLVMLGFGIATVFFTALLQSAVLGIISGFVIGGYSMYKVITWFYDKVEEPILDGLGDVYDRVIAFFRSQTPVLVEKIVSFWAYLKEKASQLLSGIKSSEIPLQHVIVEG